MYDTNFEEYLSVVWNQVLSSEDSSLVIQKFISIVWNDFFKKYFLKPIDHPNLSLSWSIEIQNVQFSPQKFKSIKG